MLPGELKAGIIDGLDAAALWVTEAQAGIIDAELVADGKPRIIAHIEAYLAHDATADHARRAAWIDALDRARSL